MLASRTHTAGNTIRWKIDYSRWLDNAAQIADIAITSSSMTCLATNPQILGRQVVFFLTGGTVNEQVTISLRMTDTLANVKNDTLQFTVVTK
jgi:hypothetical protein